MSLALFLKLVHVGTAIWLIAGVVGRDVILSRARASRDIHEIHSLLPAANIFEQRLVIPGSQAVLVVGLLTAWAQHLPILGFLQGRSPNWVLASLILYLTTIPVIIFVFVPRGKLFEARLNDAFTQGVITPELNAAFRDPAVRAARTYEIIILIIVVALMVLKPF